MLAFLAIQTVGVGLIAAWGLIAPVAVVERCNARAAFSRSWALLSGNRWILAWLDIAMIMIGAIPMLAAFPLSHTIAGAMGVTSAKTYLPYSLLAADLLSSIMGMLWLMMTAVSYRQLRSGAAAAMQDNISDVFA